MPFVFRCFLFWPRGCFWGMPCSPDATLKTSVKPAPGDVTLQSCDGQRHRGHRNVLSAASSALKSLLGKAFNEGQQIQQGEPIEIAASGDVVAALLDHIYGGEPDISRTDATELLRLAGAYELPRLVAEIESDSCFKWGRTDRNPQLPNIFVSSISSSNLILKIWKLLFPSGNQCSTSKGDWFNRIRRIFAVSSCYKVRCMFCNIMLANNLLPDGAPMTWSVICQAEELRSSMDGELALQLLQQIHLLGQTDLRRACEDEIAHNFESCAQLSNFAKLSPEQLARILERNDLWVTREEIVLQGLFKWIKVCPERKRYLGMMLRHIDFTSLSASNLKNLSLIAQSMGQHGFELQYSAEEALRALRSETYFYGPPAKRRCLQDWSPELGSFTRNYSWGQWVAGDFRGALDEFSRLFGWVRKGTHRDL